MSRRPPTALNLILLALAAGLPSSLFGQRPEADQHAAGLQTTVPAEVASLQKQSRSHVRLERQKRPVHVYLFAADEKADVLEAPFCGGDQGAKQYSGDYQLVSVVDNAVVSRLDLDPDVSFVEKKPHDGVRLYRDPKTGQDLVVLFQYGTCNSESVQFFSADPSGRLYSIPFLDKDGRTWSHRVTGPAGAIPHLPDGSSVFSAYANNLGYDFCEAYAFDGANFQETDKWMTQGLAEPVKGLNAPGRATRALFDFLSGLSAKNYLAAAYYFAGKVETAGTAPPAGNSAEKAKILEACCTTQGGQCLMPTGIVPKAGGDAPGKMLFQVSFETPDFKPFRIGARASFEFRVAKTPEGFKVLDLPPRLP
jgi:hypothetical protein